MKSSSRVRPFLRTVLFFFVPILVIGQCGCTKPFLASGGSEYQLPWPQADGNYSLQNIRIESLDRPAQFEGRYATILLNPYVKDGKIASSAPAGRFAVGEGKVNVPTDLDTLQAVTVYAHIERLHEIDSKLGIEAKLNWPLKVGMLANVAGTNGPLTNNALFDSHLDSLIIVPYNGAELPITLNAGILAHEHFHTIFQALVLSGLPDSDTFTPHVMGLDAKLTARLAAKLELGPVQAASTAVRANGAPTSAGTPPAPQSATGARSEPATRSADPIPILIYNRFLVRGINEGLADFWGWVYTGDANFIGHSLAEDENQLRRMDIDAGRLPDLEQWKERLLEFKTDGFELKTEDERYAQSYQLGTYYSRFLRELTVRSGSEAAPPNLEQRLQMAKAVIEALPILQANFVSIFTTEYISPDVFLKPLYLHLPQLAAEQRAAVCGLYTKFKSQAVNEAASKAAAIGPGCAEEKPALKSIEKLDFKPALLPAPLSSPDVVL